MPSIETRTVTFPGLGEVTLHPLSADQVERFLLESARIAKAKDTESDEERIATGKLWIKVQREMVADSINNCSLFGLCAPGVHMVITDPCPVEAKHFGNLPNAGLREAMDAAYRHIMELSGLGEAVKGETPAAGSQSTGTASAAE